MCLLTSRLSCSSTLIKRRLDCQGLKGYDLYFAMARGVEGVEALDMSKFFDTNYHYMVPELDHTSAVSPDFTAFLEKVRHQ